MSHHEPRIAPEIFTSEGKYFQLLNPDLSDFGIETIAHALSNICRFTGHTKRFYSVAQHSVIVSKIVPEELAMQGLLHDAAEAFLGDVATPLKRLLPDYKNIERFVEQTIFSRFSLPDRLNPMVKHADLIALATEKRDLLPPTPEPWDLLYGIEPLQTLIYPVEPRLAKQQFLSRFKELSK